MTTEKEFCLSEKGRIGAVTKTYFYKEEDIKKFIKRLKGTLNTFQMHHWNDENQEHSDMPIHQSDFEYLKKEIYKLAGNLLIEEKK